MRNLREQAEEALGHHVTQQDLCTAKRSSCLITRDQGGGLCVETFPLCGKLWEFALAATLLGWDRRGAV